MIKSAPSGNSKTKNATNYGDYKLYLEFQSIIETANKYLQEHLSFSILCMHQKFNDLLKLQSLNSYIQNLSILIDTCSISYDEQLHKSTINDYLEVLISVEKYRYFDQLDESALLNVLTGLNKCLNLLKESKGQAFYSYGEGFFSDLVNSAIMCETINEDDKQQHPLFQQHCHILALMKARLSYPSESLLKQIVNSEQYRQQQNDNSVSPINVRILTQGHGPRHEPHVRHPNEIHPVISASPDSASSACYNILSLDGGGIRGIVEAIFLMEIERRTGKCIGELFHCFAGSSTGAILACGLAKRKPLRAKYLLNLYLGPKRFKIFRKRFLWPLSWFLASKYSEKGLEQILEAELTTERLSDCHKHDLIITTEIADQGPALFINDRNPTSSTGLYFYNPQEQNDKFSRRHTCNMLLRDVARCSSAGAPLFPSKKLDINGTSYTFYDGGYRFNQPDFIALQWAQHKQIRNENILLLSLGNSNPAPLPFPSIHDLCGFIYNTAAINEVVSFHNPGDYCVLQLGDRYIRISPNINTTVTMDATDPVTLQLLWQATWDKISEMDNNETDLFNKLCIQLLIRNKFPANLVGAWPPPRSARYYPSRHLRDPDGYNKIDKLFRSDVGFDTRRSQLPVLLNQYYSCHRWPSKNKLHYPSLNTYFCHAPLSLAAAMGHIPSILHYLHDLINNMDRSLTAEEADERSVERSNGQLKWHWNSFHYAAANGEIGAAVVLLYSEPLETVDLKTELEIDELYTMRKLLEQQTQSPLVSYTPSELAGENKYNLMKDELNREHSEIKRQIIDITNPDLN